MTQYNATIVESFKDSPGTGTFVAKVEVINGRPQMLRANHRTFTGYEDKIFTNDNAELNVFAGDAVYDCYIRTISPNSTFTITIDNCEGYKNVLENI